MDRSEDYKNGFRHASRIAVHEQHKQANDMNDPNAQQVLNAAAFRLGVYLERFRAGDLTLRAGKAD